MGKSALAKCTINFMQDRGFIDGGCIYMNCRYMSDITVFIKALVQKIEDDPSGAFKFDNKKEEELESPKISESNYEAQEYSKFFHVLKLMAQFEEKFVFFFDNVDMFVNNEDNKFIYLIEDILSRSPNTKVMITSWQIRQHSNYEWNFDVKGL